MAEMEERELLLRSLKGYLTDLADSGVEELPFGSADVTVVPTPAVAAVAEGACGTDRSQGTDASQGSGVSPDLEVVCRQEGNARARLLFLMSGPGYAGAAGDLLTKIIAGMKFKTDQVCLLSFDAGADSSALANVVRQRLDAVAPELVVALGEEAAGLLFGAAPLEQVRGQFQQLAGRVVMPTLHPEALLADESLKRQVWEEMKLVMRRLAEAA